MEFCEGSVVGRFNNVSVGCDAIVLLDVSNDFRNGGGGGINEFGSLLADDDTFWMCLPSLFCRRLQKYEEKRVIFLWAIFCLAKPGISHYSLLRRTVA